MDIAKYNPNIFEVYEKCYSYWDLTKTKPEEGWRFKEYLSSPLIEILISDSIFSWYIEERILKNDSFKLESIALLWKVNNNFKNLYLSKNKSEFIEKFSIIFDIFLDFFNESYFLVDNEESLNSWDGILLMAEHVMHIINNSFKNSMVIKYLILTTICEYVKCNPWEDIKEDVIEYLIRRYIPTGEQI